ncbi:thioesterase II family protein [Micromonospora sp. NPDC051925]|uniref:thioesterase II family protein n=1 Tax=Micromonospora sp. NPDC051925 TaxID=3364288 RepID=UPI0037C5F1D4
MTSWFDGTDPADQHGPRLFCFPHAGGGGRFFHPWRRLLAPDLTVRPVVPPGREGRFGERAYDRMELLVEGLVEAVRPELDRPFVFFGHSLGAAVAYETAVRLRQLGLPEPSCLVVSGRRAPHLPLPPPYLHLMDDDQFIAEVIRLGGTPATILDRPQVLKFYLPTLRADYELNEVYRPTLGRPLSCPVFGYAGDADPIGEPADVAAWKAVSSGPFAARVFAGAHFYLKDRSEEVLAALRKDLAVASVGVTAQN